MLVDRRRVEIGRGRVLILISMNNFRITLFGKGEQMTQQFGSKQNPTLYGEWKMPQRIWKQFAGGTLENGTTISSLCVEGEPAAAGAHS